MIPEDDADRYVDLCTEAAASETGQRLFSSIYTDQLMWRVVGDHPDPDGLALDIGADAIIGAAQREHGDLTEHERERLAEAAFARLRSALARAAKNVWRLEHFGVLDPEDVSADLLLGVAGAFVVAGD